MKVICYLTYGFPSIQESLEIAECYIQGGCDMIEVSLPTSNPYLEPALIAEKMHQALAVCDDYDYYLEQLALFVKRHPQTPITFVMYEHLIAQIGDEKLAAYMSENGIRDLIYAGEVKYPEIRSNLIAAGIRISSPVSFMMSEEELSGAVTSNGFVYMEGINTRGAREGFETLDACISELRRLGIDRPIYCGVGIHTEADVRRVKVAGGDGIFMGSALIRQYDQPEKMMETIQKFKVATQD